MKSGTGRSPSILAPVKGFEALEASCDPIAASNSIHLLSQGTEPFHEECLESGDRNRVHPVPVLRNLLMGEFERSGLGQKKGWASAVADVFTVANFEIAMMAALLGYVCFEFLRKRF